MILSLRYTIFLLLGSIGRVFMKENQICYHDLIDFGDESCKRESIKFDHQNTGLVENDLDGYGERKNNECEVYKYNEYPPLSGCVETDELNTSDKKSRKKLKKYKRRKLKGSKRKRKKEKKKKQWKRKRRK